MERRELDDLELALNRFFDVAVDDYRFVVTSELMSTLVQTVALTMRNAPTAHRAILAHIIQAGPQRRRAMIERAFAANRVVVINGVSYAVLERSDAGDILETLKSGNW